MNNQRFLVWNGESESTVVRSYQAVSMTEQLGGVLWSFLSVLSVLRGRNVEVDGNRGVGGRMGGWVMMAL